MLVALAPFVAQAETRTLQCPAHSHKLRVTSVGHEHVSHHVTLNKHISVTEAERENWFVESITCTSNGFNLSIGHRQYGERSQKRVHLKPLSGRGYVLEPRV